jgi:hypothetical protein
MTQVPKSRHSEAQRLAELLSGVPGLDENERRISSNLKEQHHGFAEA